MIRKVLLLLVVVTATSCMTMKTGNTDKWYIGRWTYDKSRTIDKSESGALIQLGLAFVVYDVYIDKSKVTQFYEDTTDISEYTVVSEYDDEVVLKLKKDDAILRLQKVPDGICEIDGDIKYFLKRKGD